MPLESEHGVEEPPTPSQRLTNDDFRKLLMTPRAPPGHASGSVREAMANSRYMLRISNCDHFVYIYFPL